MFTLKALLAKFFSNVQIKGNGTPWEFDSLTFLSNAPKKGNETLQRFYLIIGRKICMFLTWFFTPFSHLPLKTF
jgi:hypothetical protein